jgi:hypothetical protein
MCRVNENRQTPVKNIPQKTESRKNKDVNKKGNINHEHAE